MKKQERNNQENKLEHFSPRNSCGSMLVVNFSLVHDVSTYLSLSLQKPDLIISI